MWTYCRLWLAFIVVGLLPAAQPAYAGLLDKTDPKTEVELGRQVARIIDATYPATTDKALQERVDRVGKALVEQLDKDVYPYQFKVLAVPDFNAFSLPGGFIYVFEGALAQTPDDNALAFLLAHELTHSAHRHWAVQVEKMKGMELLGSLVAGVTGTLGGSLLSSLAVELVRLHYSRDQEDDADRTALDDLWKAGFDLAGGETIMQVIVKLEEGTSIPAYLRSHPKGKDRLAKIVAHARELAEKPRPEPKTPASPETLDLDLVKLVGTLPPVTPAPNPCFPLAPGNTWTYAVQQASGAKSAYTIRIAGTIPIRDFAVYTAEVMLEKNITVPFQYLTTAGEVWKRSRPTAADSPWQLEFVTAEPAAGATAPSPYTLVGSEDITVPCGNFPAAVHVRKQTRNPDLTLEMWFVAGIGMVKRTCVETGVTETLTQYQVQPPAKEEPKN